ncbi:MAG: Rrf2 family transcriptional regulator [Pirellulaceae bacterium]|jgi:Rrf2 family protein|nr:Rrf2 family transcriptional regulator [Planctomycetaceae bacterium]MDP6553626.1 Rrf2 family transcriptional regulator [Pirellulaceae bacterium]MDP6721654.1 Rrf2 family transcriptional regulator [Pirellulaceae bacterium]
MHLSAKTEYACIAVLELATRFGTGKPVRIREIADPNGIPSRFLVQILLQLKSAGIVGSTRGAAGGYQLMKEPSEITLAEVMAASEGQIADPISSAGQQTPATRSLFAAWNELAAAERKLLESISFAQLAEHATNQTDNMYYI